MSQKDESSARLEKVLSDSAQNSTHKEDIGELQQDATSQDWSEKEERALVSVTCY